MYFPAQCNALALVVTSCHQFYEIIHKNLSFDTCALLGLQVTCTIVMYFKGSMLTLYTVICMLCISQVATVLGLIAGCSIRIYLTALLEYLYILKQYSTL